jgi:hypothetical protein
MADEKSEWGEAGQPSEGGVLKDDRRPSRPSRSLDDETRPPRSEDGGSGSSEKTRTPSAS